MSGANQASTTNQKLDAARRFIRQSQDNSESWLSSGIEAAALFHLRSALNGLLQEVKSAYRLKSSLEIDELMQEAKENDVVIPVLNELFDLLKSKNSWLSQLMQAYQVEYKCLANQVVRVNDDNLIGRGNDGGTSISLYLSKLTELVLRFREESSEY